MTRYFDTKYKKDRKEIENYPRTSRFRRKTRKFYVHYWFVVSDWFVESRLSKLSTTTFFYWFYWSLDFDKLVFLSISLTNFFELPSTADQNLCLPKISNSVKKNCKNLFPLSFLKVFFQRFENNFCSFTSP